MNPTLLNMLMVAVAWAASGLITYGFMKAKMFDFDRRLVDLERDSVTRTEYESRHGDLLRQLDRIENKLDRISGSFPSGMNR